MNEALPDPTPPPEHAPPRGGGVVFWLLVLMGLSTLAPCVILPEWRAYQVLSVAQQAEQHRVDTLQCVVDRERRLLEALRSDQSVIDRLAQRELNFQRAGERVVRVSVPPDDGLRTSPGAVNGGCETPFVAQPVRPPRMVERLGSFLPAYHCGHIFCDDETRPILLCMSVALICTAFGLFGTGCTSPLRGGR